MSIVIPIFKILVNTNLFQAGLVVEKIHKTITTMTSALLKTALTLKNANF